MFSTKQFVNGLLFAALLMSACQPIQPVPTQSESTAGIQQSGVQTFAQHGPFGVGYRSLVSEEKGARSLEIHSWYPAVIPADGKEAIEYEVTVKDATWTSSTKPIGYGRALRDATVDAGQAPYPLVIFSHGFSASPVWYNTLVEHYASHGFIVLAPEHSEQFDLALSDMWKALVDRPNDVKQTLDYAERLTAPGGAMAGLIDMANVAVVGHSYGGYTALAMAGAQIDFTAYRDLCAALSADDPRAFLCQPIVPMEAEMAARAGLDPMPAGLWESFGDPRVKAIIPMAGDAYHFGEAGLSKITIPMLVIGGTADTGTPFDWGSRLAYDFAASEQKTLVGFEGAEHMIFSTPCESQPWLQEHPYAAGICTDPVWDKTLALDLIHHFSTAFLIDMLKGDQAAHNALLPDAVQFPGIEYQTTLR